MIGETLGDRYEIVKKIGEGGMANVYKAKCNLLNRYVAVKVLKDEFVEDSDFIKKFRRESQAAASLSHPNILNVYDVGEELIKEKEIHYIVMEYIDGYTLKEYIQRKGKLSSDEAIDFSIQIAEALKNAHENHIIHRDIKPQNIMITKDKRAKVTDFGIARAATSATITATSNALGSVHYFSPEQARGGYIDEKSDIYSLGVVMFEMVTGQLPYDGETPIVIALKHIQEDIPNPRLLNEEISEEFAGIILRCTAKQQADRYSNVEKIINDLNRIKNGNFVSQDTLPQNNQATQVIDTSLVDEELDEKNQKNKDKKTKKKWKVTILAILLAFLVVTAGFFGMRKLFNNIGKEEVTVPNFVGMKLEDAEEKAEELGLIIRVKGTTQNNEYESEEIVKQSVEEGTKVKEGYEIEVIINEVEDLVKVPSVVSKTLEEAEETILKANLEIGEIRYKASNATPKGIVLDQEPGAYRYLEPGSKVNLIVSEGEMLELVRVPKVTGLSELEAKSKLLNLGLDVEIIREFSNDVNKGIVMWQSINAGEEIEKGKKINLQISNGAKPEEKPQEPSPEEVEGPLNISIKPKEDQESTEIIVIKRQDGQSKEVYRGVHTPEQEVVITVQGKVGAEFDVFFGDTYQFTRKKEN